MYEHHLTRNDSLQSDPSRKKPRVAVTSGKSPLTVAELVEFVGRCVYGYVLSGDALKLPKLPILGGLQRVSWENLTIGVERFMLAHEYGHALAGHLNRSRTPLNARRIGGRQVFQKSWEDEFEADKIGARLVLFHARKENDEKLRSSFEHFAVASALIFFELDNLVTEVALAFKPEQRDYVWLDHPPAYDRAEKVRQVFNEEGAQMVVDSAQDHVEWFSNVTKWTSLLAGVIARAADQEGGEEDIGMLIDEILVPFAQSIGAEE